MIVDGEWSKWSPVGECSTSCGKGFQKWERKCDSPPPAGEGSECVGQSSQTRECQKQPCPGIFFLQNPPFNINIYVYNIIYAYNGIYMI